jgi:3-methyladenine DNA glycosylase AlkC
MADNPNAFKHWIGEALLRKLAREVDRAQSGLETRRLRALMPRLAPLELKDRVRLVRDTLREILPPSYPRALSILMKVARQPAMKGFDLWPITEFVQAYGVADFDRSMRALHVLTQRFTAEFAVRPFLQQHHARTFEVLRGWATDPNPHVRRAASEGSRPRLPWGERVPALIGDPRPGLAVLEVLRFDPELYVRKSVANHLNDISKDHPALVIETLRRWKEEAPAESRPHVEWIVRHALRGLIKRGHPDALALVGAAHGAHAIVRGFAFERRSLRLGDTLRFGFTLESTASANQRVVVDYVVHFVNASGRHGVKVFKLRTFDLTARARVMLTKSHSLKPITTRTYYPGEHRLQIQVNGEVKHDARWKLVSPAATARSQRQPLSSHRRS